MIIALFLCVNGRERTVLNKEELFLLVLNERRTGLEPGVC